MITALGVFGWILRKLDFALAPVILGFVLGGLFEDNLRRALSISGGDWGILFQSVNAVVLYGLAFVMVLAPILLGRRKRAVSDDE